MYALLHASELFDDTDRVQRDLMLVNRSLRSENTCVMVLSSIVENVVYA